MLSVARGEDNLECSKTLLKNGANFNCKDEYGNTVLHIAAMNGNNKALNYLSKNLKINLFERNQSGETALNICSTLKNAEGAKILEQHAKEYDVSQAIAEKLLEQLGQEEEHDEEAKAKRKQKKWRNKVNKIAKQENISVEEVEKRLAEEEDRKKEEEAQRKRDEIAKQKEEEQALIRRKEEIRKARIEA